MTMSTVTNPSTDAHNYLEPNTTLHNNSHVDNNLPTISEPTTATETSPSHTIVPSAVPYIASSTAATAGLENMSNTAKQPIQHGTLSYKAPGVLNAFRFSKKYFWFGNEPVPHEHLNNYLRGEKAEIAHPTAAWSSQTGQGLLYFAKHGDQKRSPHGILNLSEVSDLRKDGTLGFVFNLHGQKHAFQAATTEERDEWVTSLEVEIEKAKVAKEFVVGNAGYKDTLSHLGRTTALAAGLYTRATSSSRKSSDLVTAGGVRRDNVSSSSSSSSDGEKKVKKSRTAKSRSVSRGKRSSIFGNLMGKKEEHDERKEHTSAEKMAESDVPFHAGSAAPLDATAVAARVLSAPTEDSTANVTTGVLSTAEPSFAGPAAATSAPTASKSSKRGSVFGNFINKMTSPTMEKKEHDVAFGVPSRDNDAPVVPTAAGTSADAMVTSPIETSANRGSAAAGVSPVVRASATPHREKESFFGRLMNKEKARAPTSETSGITSSAHEPATAPAVASENLYTSSPIQATSGEHISGTTPEAAKEKRRTSSFFINLGGSVKKDRISDSENAPGDEAKAKKGGLSDIFRRPSNVLKGQKGMKETASPAAVPTATETSANHNGVPLHLGADGASGTMDTPAATESTTTNRNTIGDVVPNAASIGQRESRTPAVHASA